MESPKKRQRRAKRVNTEDGPSVKIEETGGLEYVYPSVHWRNSSVLDPYAKLDEELFGDGPRVKIKKSSITIKTLKTQGKKETGRNGGWLLPLIFKSFNSILHYL